LYEARSIISYKWSLVSCVHNLLLLSFTDEKSCSYAYALPNIDVIILVGLIKLAYCLHSIYFFIKVKQ